MYAVSTTNTGAVLDVYDTAVFSDSESLSEISKQEFDRIVSSGNNSAWKYVAGRIIENFSLANEASMTLLRNQRNKLLAENVDAVLSNPIRWSAMSETEQAKWTAYRQSLLDMPQDNPLPTYVWNEAEKKYTESNFSWPEKP